MNAIDPILNAHALHNANGRVFVRAIHQARRAGDYSVKSRDSSDLSGAVMLFGVVELPKSIEVERMHTLRMNSNLWVDCVHARQAKHPTGHSIQQLGEHDAGSLYTAAGFAFGALPDAGEAFVRATHLEHENFGMRWVYVIGALAERPRSMSVDGLYEVGPAHPEPKLVSSEPYMGVSPSSILREPVWGPGGRYGFSTSREPNTYDAWIEGSRAENGRRDPAYGLFLEAMKAEGAVAQLPEVYTAEMVAHHKQITDLVFRKVCAESAAQLLEQTGVAHDPAEALTIRTRMARP